METLKQAVPAMVHVGLLGTPGTPPELNFFREMERGAPQLGLRVRFVEARTSADYRAAFIAIAQHRLDGLVVASSVSNHDHWKRVVDLAAVGRLPVIYPYRDFTEAGGLMSYGVNRREFFGRAAAYVDKILKGAKPAGPPIEQPTKFELVVNLQTARALGLTIPPALLLRADHVIE